MDIRIIYFSQTGNTYRVASVMADVFQKENHQARLIALEEAKVEDAASGDLLGVGTPCFSSRAPQPVMQFLAALPTMKNHDTFVFATSGGAPGKVLSDIASALCSKGANVLAGHLTRGEVYHPAPSLKGRFPGRPNDEDLYQVQSFTKEICDRLSNPSTTLARHSGYSIQTKWSLYDFLGSAISDPYVRFFLPKPKLDLINCDMCGWCHQECPTQNINMEPYPVLGSDCIRCYHCYNRCPNDAFALHWHIGNPLLWLLYHPVLERWFGDLKPGERVY